MNTHDPVAPWFRGGLIHRYKFVAYQHTGAVWNAVGSDDNPAELRRRIPGATILPAGELPGPEHLAEQG